MTSRSDEVIRMRKKGRVYVCQCCGGEFFVPQYEVNYRPNIKYCSVQCYHAASKMPDISRKCLFCGSEFVVQRKHKEKKFCNTKCACAFKRSQERIATLGTSGYRYVWFTDGSCQPEHRYLVEKALGRKLNRDEVVHHIDGDRSNNALENLVVLSRGEHSKIHRDQDIAGGKALFGREDHGDKQQSQGCEI